MDALLKELALQKDFFLSGPSADPIHAPIVETVYLGGGTPSLLSTEELKRLLNRIHQYFVVASDCEVTLEANPDDITMNKAREWLTAGINRLSIGIQSFFDEDLRWMNRAHNAAVAGQCIRQIREAGFENFSADLIYGMPTLPDSHWEENITRMISLDVPHLSCYGLTVESRTPLDYFIRQKKYPPVSEERVAHQFEMLMDRLLSAGYEHYEISNFARPGKRSRHNSHYWQGVPYLGIGPSAHSYTSDARQWNIANNTLYIKNILENNIPAEKEILTPDMQWNEYIMTSLRTIEGCNLEEIKEKWGQGEGQKLKAKMVKFIAAGQIVLQDQRLTLTKQGKLFADAIASELFR